MSFKPGKPCYRTAFHEWVSRLGVLQIWILAAQFEVRQLRMVEARKILGMSLGLCPKDRTYKAYIEVGCLAPADAHCATWLQLATRGLFDCSANGQAKSLL